MFVEMNKTNSHINMKTDTNLNGQNTKTKTVQSISNIKEYGFILERKYHI